MEFNQISLDHLANTIYGEAANKDYDTMLMVGSTAINRFDANKKEFYYKNEGDFNHLIKVINKGYYAARDKTGSPSPMYLQADEKKFPDKNSELKYKQAYAIASGLIRGTIEPTKGMFYFTPKEEKNLKAKGDKVFNFKAVNKVSTVGGYNVYSY